MFGSFSQIAYLGSQTSKSLAHWVRWMIRCGFAVGMLALVSPAASAASETILHVFSGQPDGAFPQGALVADGAGNLYGTTVNGGTYDAGTVFELSPPATAGGQYAYQVIYSFSGGNDGSGPYSDLIIDNAGSLFGATRGGGSGGCSCGTVFKLKPPAAVGDAWTEKALYSFQGGLDGTNPSSGALARDSTGAIYGTTQQGGLFNGGRAFKLTSGAGGNWTETVLVDFSTNTSSYLPWNGLVFDSHGNLLGTDENGTAFKLIAPTTRYPYWNYQDIQDFPGQPAPDLVIDKYNVVYGAVYNGGTFANAGFVYKLSPTASGPWTQTMLYSFLGGADGKQPAAGLVRDAKNNVLYGTTFYGGSGPCAQNGTTGCGVVYKVAQTGSTWSETVLYSFQSGNDGQFPISRLLRDGAGNLYGVTSSGGDVTGANCGTVGCGVVYMITP